MKKLFLALHLALTATTALLSMSEKPMSEKQKYVITLSPYQLSLAHSNQNNYKTMNLLTDQGITTLNHACIDPLFLSLLTTKNKLKKFSTMLILKHWSSTLWFLLNNHSEYVTENARTNATQVKKIFETLTIMKLYKKWESDIEALIKKAPTRDFGTLSALSFDEKTINTTTYLASPGGYKHPGIRIDGTTTTNIPSILHAILHNPEAIEGNCDHLTEFCAALTGGQNGLLNPWNQGIRITPYTVEDMNSWNKECEQLFAKIADDCKNDSDMQKVFACHRHHIFSQKWIDPTHLRSRI